LLKKFGKSIDTKELLELLEPYKGKLEKLWNTQLMVKLMQV
jgi:hypothetical protein